MREVVLYTRTGCSLCVTARAVLLSVCGEVPFSLREIDIDSDADLYEEHRYDIPVIEIDGKHAFKHRVDAAALKTRLLP